MILKRFHQKLGMVKPCSSDFSYLYPKRLVEGILKWGKNVQISDCSQSTNHLVSLISLVSKTFALKSMVQNTILDHHWSSLGISWGCQIVSNSLCIFHTNIWKKKYFQTNWNQWNEFESKVNSNLIAVESAWFFSISLFNCCCSDKMVSSLALSWAFKWLIVSSCASKMARHSSIFSEYVGGSSKLKNSRTGFECRSTSLDITELMNVWRPCTRLLRNMLLKLSPNSFLRGNVSGGKCGNIDFSLLLSRWKSLYRRKTIQQSFVIGFWTRSL